MSLETGRFNPKEINFNHMNTDNMNTDKNKHWDPEEVRLNMSAELLKKKTLKEVKNKPLTQRLKEAEEKDLANLAKATKRLNNIPTSNLEPDFANPVTEYEKTPSEIQEEETINHYKNILLRFDNLDDSQKNKLEKELFALDIITLTKLRSSLFKGAVAETDEETINFLNNLIKKIGGKIENERDDLQTKTYYGPDTHA